MGKQKTYTTQYERPVTARLVVRLDNGEEWEATPDDLKQFNLTETSEAYSRFERALSALLTSAGLIRGDVTDAKLNIVRYLAETAIVFPELLELDKRGSEWGKVVEIERTLQEARLFE